MASRGKTPEAQKEKVLLRNNLDFVKVQPSSEKYGILNKNDLDCYFDAEKCKTNENFSQDYNNQEIIQFCTLLFHTWLEDYREYAQIMMKRNLTYHHFNLQQAVEQNIADQCLPLDYFIERMLQVGICSTMHNLRRFLDIMLQFDCAGFQDKGFDNMPSYIETPLASNTPRSEAAEHKSAKEKNVGQPNEEDGTHQSEKNDEKEQKQEDLSKKPLTREEYDRVPW